jgi:uncharacterized cupin superfamily protein
MNERNNDTNVTALAFGTPQEPGTRLYLPPERLVKNDPVRMEWPRYDDAGGASAGIWSGEVGAWTITFPPGQYEFFHVLSGRGAVISDAGMRQDFSAGESVLIPPGFSGVFEVVEKVEKHFFFLRSTAG